MKKRILMTTRPPKACLEGWGTDIEFIYPSKEQKKWTDEEVKEQISDIDGLFLAMNHCRQDMIDAGQKLKVVGNIGVGYDNINCEYATQKGIAVVNAPKSVTEATAELALTLIMASMRSILHYDQELRAEGRCIKKAYEGPGTYIFGKTLGIIGFGRIGKALARKAAGIGLHVNYYDLIQYDTSIEDEYGVSYKPLDELLHTSDIISLHLPLLKSTKHLIGEKEFFMMKPGAYFINTARGKIMDEQALLKALKSGHLKGAGLDVHEFEPQVSKEFFDLDNVILTPHIGTMLTEVRINVTKETLGGMIKVLQGEMPYNVVNPSYKSAL